MWDFIWNEMFNKGVGVRWSGVPMLLTILCTFREFQYDIMYCFLRVHVNMVYIYSSVYVTFLCIEETAFEAGVRVQIHSQAEPPFVHELGFGVAPGFQTFVATQEQRVSNESSSSPMF